MLSPKAQPNLGYPRSQSGHFWHRAPGSCRSSAALGSLLPFCPLKLDQPENSCSLLCCVTSPHHPSSSPPLSLPCPDTSPIPSGAAKPTGYPEAPHHPWAPPDLGSRLPLGQVLPSRPRGGGIRGDEAVPGRIPGSGVRGQSASHLARRSGLGGQRPSGSPWQSTPSPRTYFGRREALLPQL